MTTTDQPEPHPDIEKRSRECLELFVPRARRVEEHSLASDRQQLLDWAQGTMRGEQALDTNEVTLRRTFPPEELLESAAARVRPFILSSDPVHHPKVMNALGVLTREHAGGTEVIRRYRKAWRRSDPTATPERGMSVQQLASETGRVSPYVSDSDLALAWIYGDSIHLDPKRLALAEPFGVDERYQAAAQLVTDLMVLTIATLNLVRSHVSNDAFKLDPHVWSCAVVSRDTEVIHHATAYVAPADTPPPSLGEGWPDQWKPFNASDLRINRAT